MTKYDASSLKTLKGLEAVQKRPGMYIGSTDTNGLHHLVWEIIDNSIDEVLAKVATSIKVTIKQDKSIIVEDNGRGIPIDLHKESKKTGVELIFTELHAGGKFDEEGAYQSAGGLHGVGASVVNALSKKLIATVYREGKEYVTIFEHGKIITKTKQVGPTTKVGTKVQFWPDYKIFKHASFEFDKIKERLRESAFLISGLEIKLRSEPDNKSELFISQNGIEDFVKYINESKASINKPVSFKGELHRIEVEVGFQYTNDYNETIISFANNIKTRNGGTHEQGFKTAWTKIINEYARNQGLLKSKESNLEGSDIREGLTAIIAVKVPEKLLEFVGQTKDSLRTQEARSAVEEIINLQLMFWLQEHKNIAHQIINKVILAGKARKAARKARDEARSVKRSLNNSKIISSKLTPALSKNWWEKELFLVEGNSAGGSAKSARDHKYQAILPLRGKVINTEKANLIDILDNEEITTIINTIGAGVGRDFKLKDVQYGKVIIMTDADFDGAHIQTLLLTFFFRYMRELVEDGRVLIALPPLYKLSKMSDAKFLIYAWSDEELKTLLTKNSRVDIQRYKGLGEMNPIQLWDTTMDPNKRTLIRVMINDAALAERRVSTLMGDQVEPRKNWINHNVKFTMEDNFLKVKR